jgi:ankyrin repeat protein
MSKELITAIKNNTNIQEIEKLFVRSDNINALLEERDENGMTPIMHAAKAGNSEAFEFLKNKGADLNARDNNLTNVAMYAAMGKVEVSFNVNHEARDKFGLCFDDYKAYASNNINKE